MSRIKFALLNNTMENIIPLGEEIPSREEMAITYPIPPPTNAGTVCYNNKLYPVGTAITARGTLVFGHKSSKNINIGTGPLDDHGFLHGVSIVACGMFTVKANFIHGRTNDNAAIFYLPNGTVKKACMLLDTYIY